MKGFVWCAISAPVSVQMTTRHGHQASENLRLALPGDFRTAASRNKIETCRQRYISAGDLSLPLMPGTLRAASFGQLHFHLRGPLDIRDAHIYLYLKMALVLHSHFLKVRKQRRELIRIR